MTAAIESTKVKISPNNIKSFIKVNSDIYVSINCK